MVAWAWGRAWGLRKLFGKLLINSENLLKITESCTLNGIFYGISYSLWRHLRVSLLKEENWQRYAEHVCGTVTVPGQRTEHWWGTHPVCSSGWVFRAHPSVLCLVNFTVSWRNIHEDLGKYMPEQWGRQSLGLEDQSEHTVLVVQIFLSSYHSGDWWLHAIASRAGALLYFAHPSRLKTLQCCMNGVDEVSSLIKERNSLSHREFAGWSNDTCHSWMLKWAEVLDRLDWIRCSFKPENNAIRESLF